MSNSNDFINRTINGVFGTNARYVDSQKRGLGAGKKNLPKSALTELKVSVIVVLVELASSDQTFDPSEYNTIWMGMRRLFGCTKEEVQRLVNQAVTILANLRGSSRYIEFLAANLSDEEKRSVVEVIDELVLADGNVDDYEIFRRNRCVKALGLPIEEKTTKDADKNNPEVPVTVES